MCHFPTLTSHTGPWCCDQSQHIPVEFLDKHVQCTTWSCRYSYLLSTNEQNRSDRVSIQTTLRLTATPSYVKLAISPWFWDILSQTDLCWSVLLIELVIPCVTKNALAKKNWSGSVKLLSAMLQDTQSYHLLHLSQFGFFPARNTRRSKALIITWPRD